MDGHIAPSSLPAKSCSARIRLPKERTRSIPFNNSICSSTREESDWQLLQFFGVDIGPTGHLLALGEHEGSSRTGVDVCGQQLWNCSLRVYSQSNQVLPCFLTALTRATLTASLLFAAFFRAFVFSGDACKLTPSFARPTAAFASWSFSRMSGVRLNTAPSHPITNPQRGQFASGLCLLS